INMVMALPLYHIFAFMLSSLGMRAGYTFILIPNPRDIPGFVKTLSKQPFHIFPAVNTLFKGLLDNPNFKNLDFSSLRISQAGGMAATEQTARRWLETTGCAMIEGWGMTEGVAVGTSNVITERKFNGTIGVPVPSVDVIIIDDEGNPVGVNQAGEMCVKGPNVTSGYLNRDSSDDFTKDGYFRTGDIVSMDEKGYFRLLDRKKDMILVSGFNVFPNEIESVMLDCEGIIDCAVIGIPDENQGEAVKIYVIPADNNVTKDSIKEFALDNMTGYKCPRHIEFITELPKSNVGKVLRQKLREKHMIDNPQL
ncbi:MAG: AMP-binding protein, partial [Psychrobacter sp.]|nr:AMP-binding protein [Psychrobacter sp.]